MSEPRDLVVVGTSWGGLEALRTLLGALPADLDAAIVIAQHRAAESHPTAFCELLANATALRVQDAADKEPLERGAVYLAPSDYHLLVEGDALALSVDEPVAYARPSIDVLFQSAAESYRERCVGVVLTGANDDGAVGLKRIAELGGAALVQDPALAERPEMPQAALAAVPSADCRPLPELASHLARLCGTSSRVAI